MVEKVAEAMGRAWDERVEFPERMQEMARAAIAAMREPTKKMLDAAGASMSPAKRPTQARVSVRAKHGIRYRAMIDAALEEKTS